MIREAYSGFPLRPYVSRCVDLLEDGDGSVRDSARGAVIALFSASGVTDAARTDLKSEMTKRGVRKGIVEAVLSKLVGSNVGRAGSVAGSDSGVNTDTEVLPRAGASTGRRPVGTPIARTTSITSVTGSTSGAERPLSREDSVPTHAASSSVTLTIPVAPTPAGIKSAEAGGVSAISTEIPVVFVS
jgi:CLIP-associating protein 1/2